MALFYQNVAATAPKNLLERIGARALLHDEPSEAFAGMSLKAPIPLTFDFDDR
jgi:hypothetical protein